MFLYVSGFSKSPEHGGFPREARPAPSAKTTGRNKCHHSELFHYSLSYSPDLVRLLQDKLLLKKELSSVGLLQLSLKCMRNCPLSLAVPHLSEKETMEFLPVTGITCLQLMDL